MSGPLARFVSMPGVKAANFAGEFGPRHRSLSALGVEGGKNGRRVEAENLARARFGQFFRRRLRLIAPDEEAFRRAAKPP
jgi:hypothetical protein